MRAWRWNRVNCAAILTFLLWLVSYVLDSPERYILLAPAVVLTIWILHRKGRSQWWILLAPIATILLDNFNEEVE